MCDEALDRRLSSRLGSVLGKVAQQVEPLAATHAERSGSRSQRLSARQVRAIIPGQSSMLLG